MDRPVRLFREQDDHDQRHEEYPQNREAVWEIRKSHVSARSEKRLHTANKSDYSLGLRPSQSPGG